MINLDYLTLKAFEKENSDFFKGAKIQKIQQPTRKDLILSIRNKGETKKLYITVNPKFYHLAFINSETYLKRNIKIPDLPPMFCMLLRKYIDNGEITKISIPPYERIFEIHLNSINELNEKTPLCLCIELMGKHSNIILYNNETRTIIGSAHNIGPEKSKTREIRGGIPYVYPPNYKNKKDILRYFGEINYETMSDDYLGISKSFSQLYKNLPLEKIKDYVEMISEFSPAIDFENNIFSIYSELLKTPSYTNTVNEMIDTYFSNEQQKDYIENLKRKSETFLNTKIKKLENTINKIKSEINKDNSYTAFKHYGDLIINNLYNGTDFSESITVFDYEKNKNLTIPLNKNKTLKENTIHY